MHSRQGSLAVPFDYCMRAGSDKSPLLQPPIASASVCRVWEFLPIRYPFPCALQTSQIRYASMNAAEDPYLMGQFWW